MMKAMMRGLLCTMVIWNGLNAEFPKKENHRQGTATGRTSSVSSHQPKERLPTAQKAVWRETGYAALSDGIFGNGGQNIYVSGTGELQRIFRFDVTNSGSTDLLFANSHDFGERPPAYVFSDATDPDSRRLRELRTEGAHAGAIADLNGDGYDDIVIGSQDNGTHKDLTSFIYFGAPEGPGERYKYELPAPDCRGVAIGDFNGDGKKDIAYIIGGTKLRLFYQTSLGYIPSDFGEHAFVSTYITAGDLDGDGCDDLYAIAQGLKPRIVWGGSEGLQPKDSTEFGEPIDESSLQYRSPGNLASIPEGRRPKIVRLKGKLHFFYSDNEFAYFFIAGVDRSFEKKVVIETGPVLSVAVGDIRGQGGDDLVFAGGQLVEGKEVSWVYWDDGSGYSRSNRTAFRTDQARDIVIADLDGDRCSEVIVCQGRTPLHLSTESLIYRGGNQGLNAEPIRLETHDAAVALVGRVCDQPEPQVVFVNHSASRSLGRQNVYIYQGGKEGYDPARRIELPGQSAAETIPCDFNQDGWPDILVVNDGEDEPHLHPPSYLYWGGPEGFAPERRQEIPTVLSWGAAIGDIDRDGDLEIISGGTNDPSLRIFHLVNGQFDTKNFERISLDITADEARGILWPILADFNNDSWLDLFVPLAQGARSLILWGRPAGFDMASSVFLPVELARSARAADLNTDGYLDLVIGTNPSLSRLLAHDCSVMIYWGGKDGFSTSRCSMLPSYQTNSLAIADFNRDGTLDIFAGSYSNNRERDVDSFVYWGKPGGLYSPLDRSRLFGHSISGCFAADLNEDGWVDLACAHHRAYGNHVTKSVIWWNGPGGFSEQKRTWLPTIGPHGMCSVEPADIRDRGQEEYYISSPHLFPAGDSQMTIKWTCVVPAKTWVKAQLRFAPTPEALKRAVWQGAAGPGSWLDNGGRVLKKHSQGGWGQYRLALGATNGGNTPRISEVSIEYLNGNDIASSSFQETKGVEARSRD